VQRPLIRFTAVPVFDRPSSTTRRLLGAPGFDAADLHALGRQWGPGELAHELECTVQLFFFKYTPYITIDYKRKNLISINTINNPKSCAAAALGSSPSPHTLGEKVS
jgi:hypothetical protein